MVANYWSMLNFELVVIFGIFSAVIVSLLTIFGIGYLPVFVYRRWRARQGTNESLRAANELLQTVLSLSTKWDARKFKQLSHCPICLETYEEEDFVTSLPCDIRHYFHTECIEDWLELTMNCPICKVPVTHETINQANQQFEK